MALLAACRSRRSLQALGELRAGLTCSQKADSFVRGRSSGSRVAPPPTKLTFDDPAIISAGKSIGDLLNAYLVLRACAFKPLVAHAQQLLSASNRLLGPAITYGVVKRTFFRQFCAGEDLGEVWKTMRQLQQHGVAGILDYAAESDVPEPPPANKPSSVGAAAVAAADKAHYTASAAAVALAKGSSSSSASAAAAAGALATAEGPAGPQSDLQPAAGPPLGMPGLVARSYPYASELVCDSHVKDFLSAIDTASKMPQKGFAAIKITALGNPALLERMAASIVEVHHTYTWYLHLHGLYVHTARHRRSSSATPACESCPALPASPPKPPRAAGLM